MSRSGFPQFEQSLLVLLFGCAEGLGEAEDGGEKVFGLDGALRLAKVLGGVGESLDGNALLLLQLTETLLVGAHKVRQQLPASAMLHTQLAFPPRHLHPLVQLVDIRDDVLQRHCNSQKHCLQVRPAFSTCILPLPARAGRTMYAGARQSANTRHDFLQGLIELFRQS